MMNDLVSMARTAREQLARGLASLQAPGVPTHLLNVAEPVAQAMGALHRIEASNAADLVEAAPHALDAARRALSQLQGQGIEHPAVDAAIDAVAESLSLVHELMQAANQKPGNQPPPYPQSPQHSQPQPPPQYAQPPPYPPPEQPPQYAPPQPQAQQAPQYAPPQPQAQQTPQYAPPQYPPQQAVPQQEPQQQKPSGGPYRPPGAPAPAATSQLVRVDAEMGAHSQTNFYKGLSGNDVVDSGGIFIATYQQPKIGQHVLIHVSLPGGYEFDAKAVVRWTRASSGSGSGTGSHAPPGFGAQFTELPAGARELVYRYVRNREPLFHDDI
jgi:hypothetical protein